jgi:putative hemolysin
LDDLYFLGLIFVCLVLSAFFSSSETALLRLNLSKIDRLIKEKPSISLQAARELSSSTSKLLVTILLGNNVVNIFGTAAASSLAVSHFGEENGLIVATTSMTILVLIFCEILPKTIAANNSQMVSKLVALPLYAFHKVLTPVHYLFEKVIDPLIKKFQANDDGSEGPASFEELILLAQQIKPTVKRKGITPLKVIGATAKSTEIVLEEIMINRAQVKSCSVELSILDALDLIVNDRYTRLPVYDGSIDNYIGVIHLKDLVKNQSNKNLSLKELVRPLTYFSEKTKLFKAMAILQSNCHHLAIIKDEFGITQGLVTLEDIIEEFVGEIRDEFDEIELLQVVKCSENSYTVDSSLFISDINKRTGFSIKSERRDTLGGFLLNKGDGLNKIGTKFVEYEYEYEVLTIHNNGVGKVKVTKLN